MGYTAIFGGTFNPPHIGHFEMLEELQKMAEIKEIWITPTKIPPHKSCDYLAVDGDRILMCEVMSNNFSKSEVNTTEFEREGKSYTYDTVSIFKRKFPEKDFAFVCGGDMLTTFDKWYRYEELLKMLPFYAFRRSDIDDDLFDKKADELVKKGMKLTVMKKRITAVSSTDIRKDLNGSHKLLPESIFDFIKVRGIYNAV